MRAASPEPRVAVLMRAVPFVQLFGVTTLDVVRAKTFYAAKAGLDVSEVDVPVVGGHAGVTILPLFSQATPRALLSDEDIDALTKRTQDGGTEVVAAKAGKVRAGWLDGWADRQTKVWTDRLKDERTARHMDKQGTDARPDR
jgi:malate/lactate dehydrogenase